MIVSKIQELTVYESPDGGKTVYARESGSSSRRLISESPEIKLSKRWVELKEVVFLDDPAINEILSKAEMLYHLKKKET
jgi:hypothetical protein